MPTKFLGSAKTRFAPRRRAKSVPRASTSCRVTDFCSCARYLTSTSVHAGDGSAGGGSYPSSPSFFPLLVFFHSLAASTYSFLAAAADSIASVSALAHSTYRSCSSGCLSLSECACRPSSAILRRITSVNDAAGSAHRRASAASADSSGNSGGGSSSTGAASSPPSSAPPSAPPSASSPSAGGGLGLRRISGRGGIHVNNLAQISVGPAGVGTGGTSTPARTYPTRLTSGSDIVDFIRSALTSSAYPA